MNGLYCFTLLCRAGPAEARLLEKLSPPDLVCGIICYPLWHFWPGEVFGRMRQLKTLGEYCAILGVTPETSARDIRKAYLRLVKKWHPDKYARDPRGQLKAQEKLKEINEAYALLKDYRPGQPWAWEHAAWSSSGYPEGATAQWREYQRRNEYRPPERDPYEGDYQYRPVGNSRPSKFAWVLAAIVVSNLFAGSLVRKLTGGTSSAPKVAAANVGQPYIFTASMSPVLDAGPADPISQELASARKALPYFFKGSTKADVYRIHGVPYQSSEKVWQYGASRVYFVGQTVERWDSNPNSPLKVLSVSVVDPAAVFHVGSSAISVLAIQGQPTALPDAPGATCTSPDLQNGCWQYGDSEVHFYQGRVNGWKEAPGWPLRVGK